MFSHCNNSTIHGGTFQVYHNGATIGGFEVLQKAVASSAFHNSGDTVDPSKCHPNTRTAVITKIMRWILGLGVDDQKAVILWFFGPAGAGKSAIAHDIAHCCDLEELLLASFFFSRSDLARSTAKSLIATITYQIAVNVPGTREKIVATVEQDPLILTRSLEAQVTALIVEPLRESIEAGYFNAGTSRRRLIIIDGLDECNPPAVQCSVLQVISLLFHNYHLPLLILVVSRPERHLTHAFTTGSLPGFHATLALDDTYEPDDDIRLFLTDKFRQVKDTHPMRHYLEHSWPSVEVLEQLVQKSSGQFIYASTVVKYVVSIRHQPADRLNIILGIRPPRDAHEMPFGELDALYTHIFSSVEKKDKETVLLILGFYMLPEPTPRNQTYSLMDIGDLEHFFFLSRGEIEMLFGDLSSLVVISKFKPRIHLLRASLGDFLRDPTRSKEFYIDLSNIHTKCMHFCFRHNKEYSNSNDHGSHITYALENLLWHCENTPLSASSQLREEIINFSLHRPDSCFANPLPGMSLFFNVPQFLQFIKTLPFDGVDEIYNQKLREVLNFFVSKLPPYFSSSRLTLLLTLLDIPPDRLRLITGVWADIIPLPSRLKLMDSYDLHFLSFPHSSVNWKIFRDFLDLDHPLARRHAAAASACLKIIFKYYEVPLPRLQRFSRHYLTPRLSVDMEHPSYRCDVNSLGWKNFLVTHLSTHPRRRILILPVIDAAPDLHQHARSTHLQFLLEKSAYSDDLLNFARRRVFRFRYLQRKHPTYMKKTIFALARYIQRVTGGTAEVRACESIWGNDRWFAAQ